MVRARSPQWAKIGGSNLVLGAARAKRQEKLQCAVSGREGKGMQSGSWSAVGVAVHRPHMVVLPLVERLTHTSICTKSVK